MSTVNNFSNCSVTNEYNDHDRNLVTVLYAGLSIFGLMLETLVLYIVFKQNGTKLSSFNTFLVSVMSAEIMCFLLYLLYSAPCVFAGYQVYGQLMGDILGNFETVDFLALVSTTFFISLNRALSISGSKIYHRIFTPRLCIAYAIFSWVIATVAVGVDIGLKCRTAFLEKQYYFAEMCEGQSPALTATSLTIYLGVYCVAIMYGYSLYKLFYHHKNMASTHQQLHDNMSKRKRLLFYQALCIWATLFINVISFRVIPEFLSGLSAVLLTAFIILGTNFVSPVCMLIFSGETRRAAINILLCRGIEYGQSNVTGIGQQSRTTRTATSFVMRKIQVAPAPD